MRINNFIKILSAGLILFVVFHFTLGRTSPGQVDNLITFKYDKTEIKIGDVIVNAEIARSRDQRMQGLSGRTSLEENTGMLFIFEEDAMHGIWMKQMFIPIDIIWIDKDLLVVHTEENVSPDTYPEVFRPEIEARYVLEVPAGFVERVGVESLGKVEMM